MRQREIDLPKGLIQDLYQGGRYPGLSIRKLAHIFCVSRTMIWAVVSEKGEQWLRERTFTSDPEHEARKKRMREYMRKYRSAKLYSYGELK